jgi:hypothetical protein
MKSKHLTEAEEQRFRDEARKHNRELKERRERERRLSQVAAKPIKAGK